MRTSPVARRAGSAPSGGFSSHLSPHSLPARRKLYLAFAALLLLVLTGSGLIAWQLSQHSTRREPIGHAFFVSSGLVDTTSNHGITDRLQIDLNGVAAPQSGNNYYAWLLSDTSDVGDALPILLGVLPVKDGHATLSYQGSPQNTNLLSAYSRLLVTEESASDQPANPSLQSADWRFSAALSRVPDAN